MGWVGSRRTRRAVLHGRAEVRVALDAEPLDQPDDLTDLLAELMTLGRMHGDDAGQPCLTPPGHRPIALISAIDATDRAPILVMLSATSRSVDTTMIDRPIGSALDQLTDQVVGDHAGWAEPDPDAARRR